jgi:prevent-host-death family protein
MSMRLFQSQVPTLTASDVKRRGWRGVMRTVGSGGAVVITNHDEPEAVVLSVEVFEQLRERAARSEAHLESDLESLRRRFDERLAALEAPNAGDRLRGVLGTRTRLGGALKAGTTW